MIAARPSKARLAEAGEGVVAGGRIQSCCMVLVLPPETTSTPPGSEKPVSFAVLTDVSTKVVEVERLRAE